MLFPALGEAWAREEGAREPGPPPRPHRAHPRVHTLTSLVPGSLSLLAILLPSSSLPIVPITPPPAKPLLFVSHL